MLFDLTDPPVLTLEEFIEYLVGENLSMIVYRDISRFVLRGDRTIREALEAISANRMGFVVAVEEKGQPLGVVTDGDLRRWLSTASHVDLELPIAAIANANFVSASIDAHPTIIAGKFSDRIRLVPLVDQYGRLIAIALPKCAEISIGERLIGPGQRCYIVAEIGNNHNGDVELAKRLVDLAIEAGADCAKFQMRDMGALYVSASHLNDASRDLGTEYTVDLLTRFNLCRADLFELFDYCRTQGIEPLCTPWDLVSAEALREYGISAYKLASADLTNHDLLAAMVATGKPIICSTGMATEAEIKESVQLLKARGTPFCLLHCNSTYPAPFKDINLRYMDRLQEIGSCPIGYSGHERGWSVPIAAVARGACLIEKHFTIDRAMEGNDHKVSLLPDEFAAMVQAIREIEEAMGGAEERKLSQGEVINREVLAKSLFSTRNIQPGELIADDMIVVRSPGTGLQPNRRAELVGRRAARPIKAGAPFSPTDIGSKSSTVRPYSFSRPWGVPVRWHDMKTLAASTNLQLLEYHLSYTDMEAKLGDWFDAPLDLDFCVHAPELFKGDHILDLASPDESYRRRSIDELQRVVDLTRAIRKWHVRANVPLIIVNVGGSSTAKRLPVAARAELYARVQQSFDLLDSEGVELIPQTMPPFPWHFGGQSFHNLFVDPDEIVRFCKEAQMRVCLDVSHSQLACNQFQWSMLDFCEKVGPWSAHLHLADAKDVDGEGLQIGEGMIDFAMIARVLGQTCPKASFVPEIWQGHKEMGSGFWFMLDRLETWFGNVHRHPASERFSKRQVG